VLDRHDGVRAILGEKVEDQGWGFSGVASGPGVAIVRLVVIMPCAVGLFPRLFIKNLYSIRGNIALEINLPSAKKVA
jgi:hypothetical protein